VQTNRGDTVFEHLRGDARERGAAMVEYFFLIGLIAVTLLLAINVLSGSIGTSFSQAGQSLQSGTSVQVDDDPGSSNDGDSDAGPTSDSDSHSDSDSDSDGNSGSDD
jgi:Flp pilus assembly pilin Flp